MTLSKRSIYIVVVIGITIAIDQISKFFIRTKVHEEIQLIGKKFILTNVENTGAFLGLGSDLNDTLKLTLLLILPIAVLVFVLIHVFKDKTLDQWSLTGFCMIIGGGLANVYDRLIYKSVTDFLHIDLGGIFKTGIFNLADFAITSGLVLILIGSFKGRKKKETKAMED